MGECNQGELGWTHRSLNEIRERDRRALRYGDEAIGGDHLDRGDEPSDDRAEHDQCRRAQASGARDDGRDRKDARAERGIELGLRIAGKTGCRDGETEERRPAKKMSAWAAPDALQHDENPGEARRRLHDVEMDCLRRDVPAEPVERAADPGRKRLETLAAQKAVQADRCAAEHDHLDSDPGDDAGQDREKSDVGEHDRARSPKRAGVCRSSRRGYRSANGRGRGSLRRAPAAGSSG